MADTAQIMDHRYRFGGRFYNATRAPLLPGRMGLLRRIAGESPKTILEVGFGTGANLKGLRRLCPSAELFGLDISPRMMRYAQSELSHDRVTLRIGDARERASFEQFLPVRFDVAFCSYSLLLIPDWELTFDLMIKALEPNGVLFILDFRTPSGASPMAQLWRAMFDRTDRTTPLALVLPQMAEAKGFTCRHERSHYGIYSVAYRLQCCSAHARGIVSDSVVLPNRIERDESED